MEQFKGQMENPIVSTMGAHRHRKNDGNRNSFGLAVKPFVLSGPTHDLMSINPIAYEDFQTTKTAFASDGGPWVGINTPLAGSRVYISLAASWCSENCLESQLRNTADDRTVPEYGTYVANISVNMAQYGNADTLDFTWGFSPLYAETPKASDTRPIQSEINDVSFNDTMIGVDPTTFESDHSWTGSSISHSGAASVSRGSDNRGYIKLTIQYSPLPNPGISTFVSIDQWTKDINFQITTPMQSVVPGASTPTGVSTTSGSSDSSTQTLSGSGTQTLPYLNFSDGSSGSPSGLPGVPKPDGSSQTSTLVSSAAIAGIAIGGVAVLMIIAAFILFRRRRRHGTAMLEDYETVTTTYPYPVETKRRPGLLAFPPTYAPNDSIPMVSSSHETASSYSTIRGRAPPTSDYGPPPTYGNTQSVVDMSYDDIPAAPPALAEFAHANRNVISDDLEARLAAAGYLPTDDPDNLSEQEWITKYNVTRQELELLRRLYHSPRQR